jgi:hypothetical protein
MDETQGPTAPDQRLYGTTIGQISVEGSTEDAPWPRPPSEEKSWELLSTHVLPGIFRRTYTLIWTWGCIE